jgi:RNA polymerase sigma factor (sigma-70 family)
MVERTRPAIDYQRREVEVMPPDAKPLELELLAIRCQLGEPAAFDELVDRWHAPLWRYLRRMVDADETAEELLQETWLRIVRGMAKLREPKSLVPWMFGIARRTLMDQLRQRYKHASLHDAFTDELPVPEAEIDNRDDVNQVIRELEKLPLPQRELITLYYLEELSIDEVAHVLEIPAGTVKSRLYHARNRLKQKFLDKEKQS